MSYVSYTTRFINVFLLFFHSLPFYEGMTETCSSLTFMTLHDPTLQTPAQTLQSRQWIKQNPVQLTNHMVYVLANLHHMLN
ncbi:hypothetical protein BDE02_11G143600 [Populus trichocarpa]|nr:hypothetical protein BDE02_11G143600 [Populus trichocarpa]